MSRIFISFSKDFDIAVKLQKALESKGFDVWIYLEDIPPTSDWLDEIYRGIETSDIFLFLISPDSIISDTCQKEIDHASKNGKRIIPLLIRSVDFKFVRQEIRKIQAISFEKTKDFNKAFEVLLVYINTDFAWAQFHTKLQGKALDWENHKDGSRLLRGKELQEAEQQIGTSAIKDPLPTDLQRQYVLLSRQQVKNQNKFTTFISCSVSLIICVIMAYGLYQSGRARREAASAAPLRATTIAAEATAQAEQDRATQQARIAQARELSSQSDGLRQGNPVVSLLLSVEAFDIYDDFTTRTSLRAAAQSYPQIHQFLSDQPDKGFDGIAFSPDGNTIASGSYGFITLWDISTGKITQNLVNSTDLVTYRALAFSPNGKVLASWGTNGNIIIWDLLSGQIVHTLTGHSEQIGELVFTPENKTLIAGSNDGIIIWDVDTGQRTKTIPNHLVLAISPDGTKFSSNDKYKILSLWDINTEKPIYESLIGHTESILSATFSKDGNTLISCDSDEKIIIWDVVTGQSIQTINGKGDINWYLAIDPSKKTLVYAGQDNLVNLWDLNSDQPLDSLAGHISSVNGLSFSPDGKYFATSSSDGYAILWDMFPNTQDFTLVGHEDDVWTVAFNPNGKTLASGSADNNIILWDVLTRQLIRKMNGHSSPVWGISYLDTNTLRSVSEDGTTILWDVNNGNPIDIQNGEPIPSIELNNASPDGNIYWYKSSSDTIFLEDNTGHRIGDPLFEHTANIESIVFSPNSKYLASGGGDRIIMLWDTSNGKPILKLYGNHRLGRNKPILLL